MVPAGKRFMVTLAILAAFMAVAVALWPARVTTGRKVVCVYGETLSNSIHNISVPWWLAGRYRPETVRRLCDRHRRAALLYRQGQALLDAGKPAEAAKKFRAVAKIDPKFKSVQHAVTVAEASSGKSSSSKSSSSSSSKSSTSSNPPGTPGAGPAAATPSDDFNVDDLKTLMPTSVDGFYTGKLAEWPNFAQNDFDAIKSPDVITVLLTIHREPSEAKAISWIQTSLGRLYKYDRRTLTVHGRQAYFGTDRTTYGYMAWHHGRIVFELLPQNGNNRPRDTFESVQAFSRQMID